MPNIPNWNIPNFDQKKKERKDQIRAKDKVEMTFWQFILQFIALINSNQNYMCC